MLSAVSTPARQTAPLCRWLVVGGGLAGMAGAAILARRGHRVSLVEKAPRLGGIHASKTWNGFTLDFGCHLFGNEDDATTGFLLTLMRHEVLPVSPATASFLNGERSEGIEYPNLAAHGPELAGRALLDLIEAVADPNLAAALAVPGLDLATRLARRFGKTGSTLLAAALRKMAPVNLASLDARAEAALPAKRLALLSPQAAAMLKRLPQLDEVLLQPTPQDPLLFHRSRAGGFPARAFYPASGGMGGFTARAEAMLRQSGVDIRTGLGIAAVRQNAHGMTIAFDDGASDTFDRVLWTAGADLAQQAAPAEDTIGAGLHPVPMALFYFDIDQAQVGRFDWMNNFDTNHLHYRASIPTRYGQGLAPPGRAYVCVEVPTPIDSRLFRETRSYAPHIWDEICITGMVTGGRYRDVLTMAVPASYKLPKLETPAHAAARRAWLMRNPALSLAEEWIFSKSNTVRHIGELLHA
jgi:phytoene dehydrogenase-like protein